MKIVKSIFITLLCGLAILAVGYGGIVLCGGIVLQSPTEPEEITMDADISNLFYSRMEEDIQLYPWNYYPKEDTENVSFMDYSPYVENDIFYNLIAMAADVEIQEVSSWYTSQEKTIMTSMQQGEAQDGVKNNLFFYEDIIRLSGKEYQVKISCSPYSIISFSCMQYRDEETVETTEWNEKKEIFMSWIKENPTAMMVAWEKLYALFYTVESVEEWYEYVSLYQQYISIITGLEYLNVENRTEDRGEPGVESIDALIKNDEAQLEYKSDYSEMPIQMVEVKDTMLVMVQAEVTMGLYYDVLNQRIVGFHYFYE